MAKVSISKEFNVDAERLWQQVRCFNNMDKFLPSLVTSCSLEGSGENARRVCGTENGDIVETLTFLDDANKTLEYTIDNDDAPLPLENYKGRVVVKPLDENRVRFSWSGQFDAKGMSENEVVPMMEGVYNTLLENIAGSVMS